MSRLLTSYGPLSDFTADYPDKLRLTKKRTNPNNILSKVAKAIEKSEHDQLHKILERIDLKSEEFQSFYTELYSESDRALAIVSYSYIDVRLKDLFAQTLNKKITGGVKSLLDGIGPLSSSSAKIELAAGLYWLQPTTYHNIRLLRKIRNEFAHDPHIIGFGENKISDYLASMHPVETNVLDITQEFLPNDYQLSTKDCFFIRSVITCQTMIAEIATAPIAQRMGLSPNAALNKDFDELPEAVKELARSASTIICGILPIKDENTP